MTHGYYLVTGAAGFIGSNIVAALNRRGIDRILAVDNLTKADKFLNLTDCEIADYLDKEELLAKLEGGVYDGQIAAVFHQGACSDTMEHNGRYMMDNNYRYSVRLLDWCQAQGTPLLYASSASVYGGGSVFAEQRSHESPLNVYGYSKFLFDQYVRRRFADLKSQVVGFRFFNVYGQRETHKGRMASVAFHLFHQYRKEGVVRLFEGCDGYADGEQRRDFIHVDDVVAVNLHFLDNPDLSGIFNVGTGRAQSFNDVAVGVINAMRKRKGLAPMSLNEACAEGVLQYISFPDALKGKYQSFTEADISVLRGAGYSAPFLTVEAGVERYVDWLAEKFGG